MFRCSTAKKHRLPDESYIDNLLRKGGVFWVQQKKKPPTSGKTSEVEVAKWVALFQQQTLLHRAATTVI
jgi:hypothetical protein